ncbi:hypothetical protein [Nocardioides pacificus]
METIGRVMEARTPRSSLPAHVPSGAVLLAVRLSEEARGIRGLDTLRRSIDRAPPLS